MARLNPDGTLNDDWTDPFQGGDPYMGGGTDPALDDSINSLSHIFPGDNGGAAPKSSGAAPPPITGINPQTGYGYGSPDDNAFYGPTGASQTRSGTDPAYIKSRVYWLSTLPGSNPSLKSDPGYWEKQILDNGGWKSQGTSEIDPFWHDKAMQPEGAPAGGDTKPGSQVNDVLSQLLTKLFGAGAADPNGPLRKQISDKFGSLMDQYSKPVSPDDPIIQANTDAFHGTEQRSLGQYGEMAAERAHAEGVPVGAFDSAVGNATSAAGRDEATNLGSQMTNETNARRAALGGVLGQASNFSNVTDEQKLREELAVLSDATGNQQFYDSLAAGMGSQNSELDKLLATILGK